MFVYTCHSCQIILDRGTNHAARCAEGNYNHGIQYAMYNICCNCGKQQRQHAWSESGYEQHGCWQCKARDGWRSPAVVAAECAAADAARLAETAAEARVAEQAPLVEVARVAEARAAEAERLAEQLTAGLGGG